MTLAQLQPGATFVVSGAPNLRGRLESKTSCAATVTYLTPKAIEVEYRSKRSGAVTFRTVSVLPPPVAIALGTEVEPLEEPTS